MSTHPHTVTIVQRRLTDYRAPLFEQMRMRLADRQVTLRLLHGDPTPDEATKQDSGRLPWAEHLPTQYLLGDRVCWQPFAEKAAGSDLVIVTQENKLVHNLPTLLMRPWPRLAFWGHGRNLQSAKPDGFRERFKRMTTHRVDWWFAYTDLTRQTLQVSGFPTERITVVDNSIDTSQLRHHVDAARALDRAQLRTSLGLPAQAVIGLFIGSLYPVKQIPGLLRMATVLRARHPEFVLVIAGDGPQRDLVESAAAASPAVLYLGRATGARKAAILAAADLFLHPGGLGLSVLDAFVAGIPLITAEEAPHGPEIAYLAHGQNSLVVSGGLETLADATSQLVSDPGLRARLSLGALESGRTYTIESMTAKFCAGIFDALAHPPQRRH